MNETPPLTKVDPSAVVDSDDAATQKRLAIMSVTSCYRNAFYSTAVDILLTFTKQGDEEMATFSFLLKLIHSLHIFGFGIGLYQCSNIYNVFLNTRILTAGGILKGFTIMSRVWITSAWVLVLGAMSLTTHLSEYLDNEAWAYYGPAIVVVTALIGTVIVIKFLDNAESSKTTTDKQMDDARQRGCVSLRNMALCIVALGIDAAALLVDDLMKPVTWFERIYGITNVMEPVAIAVLLVTLRRQVYKFVTTQMCDDRVTPTGMQGDWNKAQKEFYDKISSVFFSAATTKLVTPWLLGAKTKLLSSKDWCHDYSDNKVIQWIMGCE